MDLDALVSLSAMSVMLFAVVELSSWLIVLCLSIAGGLIIGLALLISHALTGDDKTAIGLPASQNQIFTQALPQNPAERFDSIEYIAKSYERLRQAKHPDSPSPGSWSALLCPPISSVPSRGSRPALGRIVSILPDVGDAVQAFLPDALDGDEEAAIAALVDGPSIWLMKFFISI
jgi:hypothetical protein